MRYVFRVYIHGPLPRTQIDEDPETTTADAYNHSANPPQLPADGVLSSSEIGASRACRTLMEVH